MTLSAHGLMRIAVQEAIYLLHPPASVHIANYIADHSTTDELIEIFRRTSEPCTSPLPRPYRRGTREQCGHYHVQIGCRAERLIREKLIVARQKYAKRLKKSGCRDISITWRVPSGTEGATFLATPQELEAIRIVYNKRYADIEWSHNAQESGFMVVLTDPEIQSLQDLTPNWPAIYRENVDWSLSRVPRKPDPPPRPRAVLKEPDYDTPMKEPSEYLGPPLHEFWYIYKSEVDKSGKARWLGFPREDIPKIDLPDRKALRAQRVEFLRDTDKVKSKYFMDLDEAARKKKEKDRVEQELRAKTGERPPDTPDSLADSGVAMDAPFGAPMKAQGRSFATIRTDAQFAQMKSAAVPTDQVAAPQMKFKKRVVSAERAHTHVVKTGRHVQTRREAKEGQKETNAAKISIPKMKRRATTQCIPQRKHHRKSHNLLPDLDPVSEGEEEEEFVSAASSASTAVAGVPGSLIHMSFMAARALLRQQAEVDEAREIPLPEDPFDDIDLNCEDEDDGLRSAAEKRSDIPRIVVVESGTEPCNSISQVATDPAHALGHNAAGSAESSDEIQNSASGSSAASQGSVFWSPKKHTSPHSTSSFEATPARKSTSYTFAKTSRGLLPKSLRSPPVIQTQSLNVESQSDHECDYLSGYHDPPSPSVLLPTTKSIKHLPTVGESSASYMQQERIAEMPNPSRRIPEVVSSAPSTNHSYMDLLQPLKADAKRPVARPIKPKLSIVTDFGAAPVTVHVCHDILVDALKDVVAPTTTQPQQPIDTSFEADIPESSTAPNHGLKCTEVILKRAARTPIIDSTIAVRDFAPPMDLNPQRRRSFDFLRRNRRGQVSVRDFFWVPVGGEKLRRVLKATFTKYTSARLKRNQSC